VEKEKAENCNQESAFVANQKESTANSEQQNPELSQIFHLGKTTPLPVAPPANRTRSRFNSVHIGSKGAGFLHAGKR
jgi:hypothetical protein